MSRRKPRRRSRRGHRSWRQRLPRLLDYELLWTALAAVAIIGVISPQLGVRVRQYAPGDIAVADVTTPIDLEVRDPASTERLRAREVAEEPDVYDFNPRAWEPAKEAIHGLLDWGRQARAEHDGVAWEQVDADTRQELLDAAAVAAGRQISEELLVPLWNDPGGFSVATELRVAGVAMEFLEGSLVGGVEPTRADDSEVIQLRDIASQRERSLGDLSGILDLEVARQQVGDRVRERLDLGEPAEASLAELAARMLRPNLTYNSNETESRRQEAYESVPAAFYQVKRGRTLLRAGDEVTPQKILELDALQAQLDSGRSALSLAGTGLLVVLTVLALWRYVSHYRRRFRFQKVNRLYLLSLVVLLAMVVLTRAGLFVGEAIAGAAASEPFNSVEAYQYGVPVAAGGLLMLLLVDVQVAWAFAAVFGAMVGVMTQDLALTLFALLGSFAAIYGMSHYKQRTALFQLGLLLGVVNAVAVLGLALLAQPPAPWDIIAFQATCAGLGGLLVSMVVTTGLPPLEHCFQALTDVKLLELSNMNLPLLKRLAVEAPGTYHHSVVVGTLAEKAAESIGVNPLFARVAAYYHDIGKLRQPEYFIENQREGRNPHERLSPHMSALILVSHVKEGVAYAEEHGLPEPLIDMIPQHHGTRLMRFFYDKARQQSGTDGEVNPEEFRYPGPKPQSKEAAILMLADSVEAISRTLSEPAPTRLRTMIRRTIQEVVDDEQLVECGLTLADLSRVADAFLSVLAGMHHQRIEYPGKGGEERVAVDFRDEDRGTQLPGETYH